MAVDPYESAPATGDTSETSDPAEQRDEAPPEKAAAPAEPVEPDRMTDPGPPQPEDAPEEPVAVAVDVAPEESFVEAPGRIVAYQIATGDFRPAMLIRGFGGVSWNLVVFLDGSNDSAYGGSSTQLTVWKTSRVRGDAVDQWQPRVPV